MFRDLSPSVLTFMARKSLRRDPIENRAISGFSGQKSVTRTILSILQSFLHFLKTM